MHIFQTVKGALFKMLKALAPKQVPRSSVLGSRKYVMNDISRSHINLPPDRSVLSMTKYFEEEDRKEKPYERKREEMDW